MTAVEEAYPSIELTAALCLCSLHIGFRKFEFWPSLEIAKGNKRIEAEEMRIKSMIKSFTLRSGQTSAFGVDGVETTPDNPRGTRSDSIENLCKGRGE